MNFGKAIEAIKCGLAVYRDGWNGKDMFVVKQIPCTIGPDVIPGMQSLPDSVKKIILGRENKSISYENQLLLVNKDNIANSWAPSSSDVLAEDWQVIGVEDNYLTRMRTEAAELYYKKEKLGEFMGGEVFKGLEPKMQELMKLQYDTMCEYGKILDQRIAIEEGKLGKEV